MIIIIHSSDDNKNTKAIKLEQISIIWVCRRVEQNPPIENWKIMFQSAYFLHLIQRRNEMQTVHKEIEWKIE